MSVMGVKIDQFELPVCNKFKQKIVRGRRCFQVDVNEFRDQVDDEKVVENGLMLVMDYNEDKMVTDLIHELELSLSNDLSEIHKKHNEKQEAMIYIETLGRAVALCLIPNSFIMIKCTSTNLYQMITK